MNRKISLSNPVLAKTVRHTEIQIFDPIEINGDENVNFCVDHFVKYVLIENRL